MNSCKTLEKARKVKASKISLILSSNKKLSATVLDYILDLAKSMRKCVWVGVNPSTKSALL